VVRRAFAEQKTEVKFDWQPWTLGFEEAKAGRFAATFPYIRSAEREKDFLYSAPIYEIQQRAFAKPGSKLDFANPASLAGSKICLPLGWAAPSKLASQIKGGQIKKEEPKDISTCAQMVAAGRADYFITDQFQGKAAVKGAGLPADALAPSGAVFDTEALHLIVGKQSANGKDVIDRFNQGLDALKKSGAFDKIVAEYTK
jgi:polar amino acid transport system substrate-binding protein